MSNHVWLCHSKKILTSETFLHSTELHNVFLVQISMLKLIKESRCCLEGAKQDQLSSLDISIKNLTESWKEKHLLIQSSADGKINSKVASLT